VDSYSTLPGVTWKAVTGEVGYPDEGYYVTCWIAGLWSTQVNMEGIMLKAAWHWVVIAVFKQSGWGTGPHPTVCKPSVHMGLPGR
jgi:hypothetical protein